ncbi:hypothetical protein TcCL_ESM08117 [Trypanosoma cruzi]|nr:hypothetical protein TcCL_ESM08117 [Trypanosoma cruzi]
MKAVKWRRSGGKRCARTKCQYHAENLEETKLSEVWKNRRSRKKKWGKGQFRFVVKKYCGSYMFLDNFLCAYGAGAPAPGDSVTKRCQNSPTLSIITVTEEN